MWFLFAEIYAVLMATVIVFDRFIVKNVFTRPLQGLFITIPTSACFLMLLLPFITWPSYQIFWLAVLAGGLLQCTQFFYFLAMDKADQAGDLSAVEASYPVLVAIISLYLGQQLSPLKWVGILIVVSSVIFVSWRKVKQPSAAYFAYLLGDIICLALHAVLVNAILARTGFLSFYGPYSLGIVLFGILPFLRRVELKAFIKNWKPIKKVLPYLALMEMINVIALLSATFALGIGHPALVTAVMTTYPALVFLFTHGITKKYKIDGFGKVEYLNKKIIFVLLLAVGIGLIAG